MYCSKCRNRIVKADKKPKLHLISMYFGGGIPTLFLPWDIEVFHDKCLPKKEMKFFWYREVQNYKEIKKRSVYVSIYLIIIFIFTITHFILYILPHEELSIEAIIFYSCILLILLYICFFVPLRLFLKLKSYTKL